MLSQVSLDIFFLADRHSSFINQQSVEDSLYGQVVALIVFDVECEVLMVVIAKASCWHGFLE